MPKHRDRIGIIEDVLKAAGKGAGKTRIMYIANLGYGLLRKYLDEAVGSGYLRLSREMCGVTEDGDAFLKVYSEYSKRCAQVGKILESMKLEKETRTKMCETNCSCSHVGRPFRA